MNRFRCVRTGFNIIELMTVLSVIGALLSLSASVLAKAGKAHVSAVKAVAELRSLAALQDRIRFDAGQSASVDASSKKSIVLQRDAGLPIRYRVVEASVVREILDSGKVTGIERWRFSSPPQLNFELSPSLSPVANGDHHAVTPLLHVRLLIPDLSEASNTTVIVARIGSLRYSASPDADQRANPKALESSTTGSLP